jgi:tRNA U34 5-carboxymethylaminomethyl modifying enzyme MnmG/GidA
MWELMEREKKEREKKEREREREKEREKEREREKVRQSKMADMSAWIERGLNLIAETISLMDTVYLSHSSKTDYEQVIGLENEVRERLERCQLLLDTSMKVKGLKERLLKAKKFLSIMQERFR